MSDEKYEFDIGPKGQEGLDILDVMFNPNTQQQLLAAGLKPGMRVLDIGCGRGAMSVWLAEQVGPQGSVLAIDNNENQINATIELTQRVCPPWLTFKVLSAYDIAQLKETFDLIYCRFILHHLKNPTQIIQKVYDKLPKEGLFVAEEGIVSAAYSYPPISGWGSERLGERLPLEKEGEARDGNFGMKLYTQMKSVGFDIQFAMLHQPLLYTQEQKQLLAGAAMEGYKQYAIDHGMSQDEWHKRAQEMHRLINDDKGVFGFYQSCLVVGKKPLDAL
ncbi:MAG: class I SAM-dependent methyltransferase [Candidatus Berkiella sp.]